MYNYLNNPEKKMTNRDIRLTCLTMVFPHGYNGHMMPLQDLTPICEQAEKLYAFITAVPEDAPIEAIAETASE